MTYEQIEQLAAAGRKYTIFKGRPYGETYVQEKKTLDAARDWVRDEAPSGTYHICEYNCGDEREVEVVKKKKERR